MNVRKAVAAVVLSAGVALAGMGVNATTADAAVHDRAEGWHLYHTRLFTDGCRKDFRNIYNGMVKAGHAKRGDVTVKSRKHPGYVHQYDANKPGIC